jgi:hypothetical protein
MENGARVDGNEAALPDPQGAGRSEHLDSVEPKCAEGRVLVDEDDTGARCRGALPATGLPPPTTRRAPAVLRVVAAE